MTRRSAYALVSLAAFCATAAPFLVTRHVPLLDLPNHLARAYVLAHPGEFAGVYQAAWELVPNLGMDGVMAALLQVTGVTTAGTIFLMGMVALTHAGVHVLARELHGRASFAAPAASFFLFSSALFLGFTSYLLGVGLFYLAFAAWIRFWRTGGAVAFGLALILALVCCLAHLSASLLLVVAAPIWLLVDGRGRPAGRRVLALVPVIAPLIFDAAVAHGQAGDFGWDGPAGKLRVAVRTLRTYDPLLDVAFVIALLGGLFLLVRGRRPLRPALAVGAALLCCFIVAPASSLNGWALDQRFLVPGFVLCLLAFDVEPRPRAAHGLVLAAIVARAAFIAVVWARLGGEIAGYVGEMDRIPRGARVFDEAFPDPAAGGRWQADQAFTLVACYATITRGSPVYSLFTMAGLQPLRKLGPLRRSRPRPEWPPERVDWRDLLDGYDAIWLYRPPDAYRAYLGRRCRLADAFGEVVLYQRCVP